MSEFTENQYTLGCDLAIEVIKDGGINGKAIATSLLTNVCSPYPDHCPITQGIRDTAKDFINGGSSIPVWMEYESLSAA
jgi:hypothetical protein